MKTKILFTLISFCLASTSALAGEKVELDIIFQTLKKYDLPGDCNAVKLSFRHSPAGSPQKVLKTSIEGTMMQDGERKFKSTQVLFYQPGDVLRDTDGGFTYYVSRNYVEKFQGTPTEFYDRLALKFNADGKQINYAEVGTMIRVIDPVTGIPHWRESSLLRCEPETDF